MPVSYPLTIIRGEEEAVWRAVRKLFQVAADKGEVVLNVNMSNRCGCKVTNSDLIFCQARALSLRSPAGLVFFCLDTATTSWE